MDLDKQVVRSEDCDQSIQCIHFSDQGFCVYQALLSPLSSYNRYRYLIHSMISHLQMRFLRDLTCLIQHWSSNQSLSFGDRLLILILDCITIMVQLDSTALISLYQHDIMSLLWGCLYYVPSGFNRILIIDHLLGFVCVIHSTHL